MSLFVSVSDESGTDKILQPSLLCLKVKRFFVTFLSDSLRLKVFADIG